MARYILTDIGRVHYRCVWGGLTGGWWLPINPSLSVESLIEDGVLMFDTIEEAEAERVRLLANDCHARVIEL